jgi:methionine-gamma-lyase
MGAISNACVSLLRPGDTLVFSDPAYGGSEYLFRHILPHFHIRTVPFPAGAGTEEMARLVENDPTVKVIYIESPANPTMMLSDIPMARTIADRYSTAERRIRVLVDNTFMGPVFMRPLSLGADLVLYSATKFFGGHSDLVAGIAMGGRALIDEIKVMRTILGSNSDPDTAWLIHRSLGTLQIRMEKQQENARRIVEYLLHHDKVRSVAYPGLPEMGPRQVDLWRRQCTGTGSLVTFTLREGTEAAAFRVLDAFRHMKLAVSLGGIETLVEHPYSMTHADMTAEEKRISGIGEDMIRLSVGLEDVEDLLQDLKQALEKA